MKCVVCMLTFLKESITFLNQLRLSVSKMCSFVSRVIVTFSGLFVLIFVGVCA